MLEMYKLEKDHLFFPLSEHLFFPQDNRPSARKIIFLDSKRISMLIFSAEYILCISKPKQLKKLDRYFQKVTLLIK